MPAQELISRGPGAYRRNVRSLGSFISLLGVAIAFNSISAVGAVFWGYVGGLALWLLMRRRG